MTALVKICGLTRALDVETAIHYGADYLGFIVEAPSKRRLSVADAAKVAIPAKGIIPRVAVTVNANDAVLSEIMIHMQPDYVQCHGDESVERLRAIRKQFGVNIIKAIPVRTKEDMIAATAFYDVADLVLFDAKPPSNTDVRGGHGISFDHHLLKTHPTPDFYALAGGLSPDSVSAALTLTGAPMVDVSSGVESAPGVKDHEKIKAFVKTVKPA